MGIGRGFGHDLWTIERIYCMFMPRANVILQVIRYSGGLRRATAGSRAIVSPCSRPRAATSFSQAIALMRTEYGRCLGITGTKSVDTTISWGPILMTTAFPRPTSCSSEYEVLPSNHPELPFIGNTTL